MEILIPITLFIVIGTTVILRGPIGRALADRLAGRAAPPGQDAIDGEALRGEMDDVRLRLTELEERVDFAERVLARARQRDQLPGA